MKLDLYEKICSGSELKGFEIESVIATLKKIRDRGGLIAVSENGSLITVYRKESYKRAKRTKKIKLN